MINPKLASDSSFTPVPESVIGQQGFEIRTNRLKWYIPDAGIHNATIDFSDVANVAARRVAMAYLADRLESVSGRTVIGESKAIFPLLRVVRPNLSSDELRVALKSIFSHHICQLRARQKLYQAFRPRDFYVWGAAYIPEYFDTDWGYYLENLKIPGGPKGEAVRSESETDGPLHPVLEVKPLWRNLEADHGMLLEHFQERAAVALSLHFGPNPRCLAYLNKDDLIDLTPEGPQRTYVINLPRIKKGQRHPRDDLRTEPCPEHVAKHILALAAISTRREPTWTHGGTTYLLEPRLFTSPELNPSAVNSGLGTEAYNFTALGIARLLRAFVRRKYVISKVTNRLLNLTPRRLRYTFATALVRQGISKRGLARALDHSDTQHVQVYFELGESMVDELDKAMGGGYADLTDYFTGEIVVTDADWSGSEHANKIDLIDEGESVDLGKCGSDRLCYLHPPYSCYLCPKFRPYKYAQHEAILNHFRTLKTNDMKRYGGNAAQYDEIIIAIQEVIYKCKAA